MSILDRDELHRPQFPAPSGTAEALAGLACSLLLIAGLWALLTIAEACR